jgi:hypothetical protein
MWHIKDAAKAWGVSERMVRLYCEGDRVPGAYRDMKHRTGAWQIPENTDKPMAKAKEKK